MPRRSADFEGLFRALSDAGVDFIVVGGVAAVLQGAPIATFDLDIVHSTRPDNLDRLLQALQGLEAIYRAQGQRRLSPQRSHLATRGHLLLQTVSGPLDVLGTIGSGRDYEALWPDTQVLLLDDLELRVLVLAALIAVKEEVGSDKDLAALPVLRSTLRESRR